MSATLEEIITMSKFPDSFEKSLTEIP